MVKHMSDDDPLKSLLDGDISSEELDAIRSSPDLRKLAIRMYGESILNLLGEDIADEMSENELVSDDELEMVPDISNNKSDYDIASWELGPGDLIAFNFSVIHGAPGNASPHRRRAFSVRFVGDDATFAKRKGEISPPFPEVKLQHGEKLNSSSFPEIKV